MMNVSWIAVILLPFSQLFFAQTGDSVSCPALPSTVIHHLTTNDSVFVRCPNVTGDEITFRLHNCNGSTKVVKRKDNTTQNEDGAEFEIQGPSRPPRFKLSQLFYKLRNKQNLQHDYMNMKPRAAKKKQGVQHPIRTGRY
ncbi:hypothetical protein JZ751_029336 [Albula glossodonta]|uniref:Uncharacterized protein n=1 Tax=Albula glossodonta TaxID=121402 RepID=A0A8T2PHR8_9TELE|nr:hypothetical protein JZ751_029336 [Albula glossodonta]